MESIQRQRFLKYVLTDLEQERKKAKEKSQEEKKNEEKKGENNECKIYDNNLEYCKLQLKFIANSLYGFGFNKK